ncbi:hypothetical protein [Paenibacillus swuensis]|uniref:hypothetical protein n=1 Tax=Paenibacillus swuensis TaxID=1178515 RepID=UPI000B2F6A14|nr:hypothetical protein [Paenibacillus swuensis]
MEQKNQNIIPKKETESEIRESPAEYEITKATNEQVDKAAIEVFDRHREVFRKLSKN